MAKNEKCPCPNKSCPRNGDCAACKTHHDESPYCVKNAAKSENDDE